jgi:hypothetical protein
VSWTRLLITAETGIAMCHCGKRCLFVCLFVCLFDPRLLTAATVGRTAFWNVVPCSPLHVYRHFGGMYCPYFYYLVCEAIGAAATPGLLCQPRVIVKMIVEKQMECRLGRGNKPKFSEKTCLSATFVHHIIPLDQTRV